MLAPVLLLLGAGAAEALSSPGPIRGDPGLQAQECAGAFVERAEVISESPQKIELLRVVVLCRRARWYEVRRADVMRVDGALGRLQTGGDVLGQWEVPDAPVRDLPDILRGRR